MQNVCPYVLKTLKFMNKATILATALSICCSSVNAQENASFIGKSEITLSSDLMTPEALWAMGRIGSAQASPDGKHIIYQVGYYSVKQNKGHQVIYIMDSDGKIIRCLQHRQKAKLMPYGLKTDKK